MKSAAAEPAPADARESGSAGGQRAPRQVVRWERFLPRRSLRVLLVEYDDSTRHIVAALLRKCSYHVAAVADGLKAWEVLQERHYSFDLVLTEVAMPSLSGIGLLTKIMSSEECKNIPVIMMSSHDSIGVVYKCMLKGAVDFLVKPVRKNELRNLWQHVWRRHCSSSYANASDNNAASNHISGNAGERSKTGENNEDASDAQSSDSEPDVEIESVRKPLEPNPAEQWSISKEAKAKLEQPVDGMTKTANALRIDKLGKREGESMETGIKVVLPVQEGSLAEKSKDQNDLYNVHPYRNGVEHQLFWRSEADGGVEPGSHHKNDNPGEPLQSMDYSVKPISNSYALSEENAANNQALSAATELPHAKNGSNFSSLAPLELCFKKPEKNGCISLKFKERHVLIHSDASAFSRYGEKRIHPSQKSVPSASCIRTRECDDKCQSSTHMHGGIDNDKCTSLPTQELFLPHNQKEGGASINIQISSGGNKEAGIVSSVTQQEDGIGNHSSTGEASILHQPRVGFISLPIPVRAVPYQSFSAGYGAILHPMFHPGASLTQHCSDAADIPKHQIACDESDQQDYHISGSIQSFNFQPYKDHHQSYHMRQPTGIEAGGPSAFSCSPAEPANQNASCLKNTLNGIGSNGSGETIDAAGNTGATLESGNESGVQNCNREAVDSDLTHREAALIKFRLKRKDRCFEKRVRYHSRKKLAEQRPRVKGQFVRQKVLDSTMENEADE